MPRRVRGCGGSMSRLRSWCWSGTITCRSRTAACRITSVAPSRTGAACCRRRRAPETYASLTLQVNSPRWAGVPFTLRSGKALGGGLSRDRHPLPPPARYLLDQWPGVEPNVLRVGLTEPHVRLSTTLNGPERTAEIRQLEARSTPPRFTAYAHLIRDMLNSNPMLFIRERSRRGLAHHRPRDERMDSRRRPHAAIPSRPRGPCGRGSGRDDPRDRQGKRGSKRGKVMM